MRYAPFEETPVAAVPYLEPFVRDKVVFDVGAGNGRLTEFIAKFAKRAVAIEILEDKADECRRRGLETIQGDFLEVDFKEADVIVCFLSLIGNWAITEKLRRDKWKGTVVSYFWPLQDIPCIPLPHKLMITVDDRHGTIIPLLVYEVDYS